MTETVQKHSQQALLLFPWSSSLTVWTELKWEAAKRLKKYSQQHPQRAASL